MQACSPVSPEEGASGSPPGVADTVGSSARVPACSVPQSDYHKQGQTAECRVSGVICTVDA